MAVRASDGISVLSAYDAAAVNALMTAVYDVTNKPIKEILKQTAYHVVKSAAANTKPGQKSQPSKMAKKYRFRPTAKPEDFGKSIYQLPNEKIITIHDTEKRFFYLNEETNKTFSTKSGITPRGSSKIKKVKRITKAIKFYNKKKHKWDVRVRKPLKGGIHKIPYAGMAKAGWWDNLRQGNIQAKGPYYRETRNKRSRISAYSFNFSGSDQFIKLINLISYAGKTSPGAVRAGILGGTGKMRHIYEKKLNKINGM